MNKLLKIFRKKFYTKLFFFSFFEFSTILCVIYVSLNEAPLNDCRRMVFLLICFFIVVFFIILLSFRRIKILTTNLKNTYYSLDSCSQNKLDNELDKLNIKTLFSSLDKINATFLSDFVLFTNYNTINLLDYRDIEDIESKLFSNHGTTSTLIILHCKLHRQNKKISYSYTIENSSILKLTLLNKIKKYNK